MTETVTEPDSRKPRELRARRVGVIDEWLRDKVRGRTPEVEVEMVELRDDVYWRIDAPGQLAPALLGLSYRTLERYSPDEIIQGLDSADGIGHATRRIAERGPGNGLLFCQDFKLRAWRPAP